MSARTVCQHKNQHKNQNKMSESSKGAANAPKGRSLSCQAIEGDNKGTFKRYLLRVVKNSEERDNIYKLLNLFRDEQYNKAYLILPLYDEEVYNMTYKDLLYNLSLDVFNNYFFDNPFKFNYDFEFIKGLYNKYLDLINNNIKLLYMVLKSYDNHIKDLINKLLKDVKQIEKEYKDKNYKKAFIMNNFIINLLIMDINKQYKDFKNKDKINIKNYFKRIFKEMRIKRLNKQRDNIYKNYYKRQFKRTIEELKKVNKIKIYKESINNLIDKIYISNLSEGVKKVVLISSSFKYDFNFNLKLLSEELFELSYPVLMREIIKNHITSNQLKQLIENKDQFRTDFRYIEEGINKRIFIRSVKFVNFSSRIDNFIKIIILKELLKGKDIGQILRDFEYIYKPFKENKTIKNTTLKTFETNTEAFYNDYINNNLNFYKRIILKEYYKEFIKAVITAQAQKQNLRINIRKIIENFLKMNIITIGTALKDIDYIELLKSVKFYDTYIKTRFYSLAIWYDLEDIYNIYYYNKF